MDIPKSDLFAVLHQFNPWWRGQAVGDLPSWERSASKQVWSWIKDERTKRALMLSGARQVGKTTLYRQAIRRLIREGYPPSQLLFATFDHPLLKLAGLERTLAAWNEMFPTTDAPQMLFLDEVHNAEGWQTWLKLQVDFHSGRRIAVTGSANPLRDAGAESGVGRWETIPLPTLSFREFLPLRSVAPPNVPQVASLAELFGWRAGEFALAGAAGKELIPHFYDYLMFGGFPEPASGTDLERCQRLLREDIVDKVLKRDMTAIHGVRNVVELEKVFLYLCLHDGGIMDLPTLSRSMDGVTKSSAQGFIDRFEASHLVYRLKQFGYGKEVLRGRDKLYLADAAISGAVLLLGRKLLEQPVRLAAAVEATFFKHVFTRFYTKAPRFSYWRDPKHRELEVDIIAETAEGPIPFEVKYRDDRTTASDLKGLRLFLEERGAKRGYAITQRLDDFGVLDVPSARRGNEREMLDAKVLAIPAPLACWWLGG